MKAIKERDFVVEFVLQIYKVKDQVADWTLIDQFF
jgi:hypothetical protein